MRKAKRKRLQAKGWKIGTVKEFLGFSDEESAYIDLKSSLPQAWESGGGRKVCHSWISPRSFSRANLAWPRWKREIHRFLSIC
jgi:hypothetical protein